MTSVMRVHNDCRSATSFLQDLFITPLVAAFDVDMTQASIAPGLIAVVCSLHHDCRRSALEQEGLGQGVTGIYANRRLTTQDWPPASKP